MIAFDHFLIKLILFRIIFSIRNQNQLIFDPLLLSKSVHLSGLYCIQMNLKFILFFSVCLFVFQNNFSYYFCIFWMYRFDRFILFTQQVKGIFIHYIVCWLCKPKTRLWLAMIKRKFTREKFILSLIQP